MAPCAPARSSCRAIPSTPRPNCAGSSPTPGPTRSSRFRGSTLSHAGHFWLELFQGRPREALAAISSDPATALNLAWSSMARAQLGELDAAFAALDKAMASGYRDAGELRASNWFAPLRGDPRFEPLMKKHGMEKVPQGGP